MLWTHQMMNRWRQYYNNDTVESIKPSQLCLAVHNKDKVITLRAGAMNIDTEDDNATQVNTKIPKDLRLQNSDDDSCVLLSVDLLINLTDRHESKCLA